MDLFNFFYFALIFGCLTVASGRMVSNVARIVTWIVVGMVAGGVLPYLRSLIGIE